MTETNTDITPETEKRLKEIFTALISPFYPAVTTENISIVQMAISDEESDSTQEKLQMVKALEPLVARLERSQEPSIQGLAVSGKFQTQVNFDYETIDNKMTDALADSLGNLTGVLCPRSIIFVDFAGSAQEMSDAITLEKLQIPFFQKLPEAVVSEAIYGKHQVA